MGEQLLREIDKELQNFNFASSSREDLVEFLASLRERVHQHTVAALDRKPVRSSFAFPLRSSFLLSSPRSTRLETLKDGEKMVLASSVGRESSIRMLPSSPHKPYSHLLMAHRPTVAQRNAAGENGGRQTSVCFSVCGGSSGGNNNHHPNIHNHDHNNNSPPNSFQNCQSSNLEVVAVPTDRDASLAPLQGTNSILDKSDLFSPYFLAATHIRAFDSGTFSYNSPLFPSPQPRRGAAAVGSSNGFGGLGVSRKSFFFLEGGDHKTGKLLNIVEGVDHHVTHNVEDDNALILEVSDGNDSSSLSCSSYITCSFSGGYPSDSGNELLGDVGGNLLKKMNDKIGGGGGGDSTETDLSHLPVPPASPSSIPSCFAHQRPASLFSPRHSTAGKAQGVPAVLSLSAEGSDTITPAALPGGRPHPAMRMATTTRMKKASSPFLEDDDAWLMLPSFPVGLFPRLAEDGIEKGSTVPPGTQRKEEDGALPLPLSSSSFSSSACGDERTKEDKTKEEGTQGEEVKKEPDKVGVMVVTKEKKSSFVIPCKSFASLLSSEVIVEKEEEQNETFRWEKGIAKDREEGGESEESEDEESEDREDEESIVGNWARRRLFSRGIGNTRWDVEKVSPLSHSDDFSSCLNNSVTLVANTTPQLDDNIKLSVSPTDNSQAKEIVGDGDAEEERKKEKQEEEEEEGVKEVRAKGKAVDDPVGFRGGGEKDIPSSVMFSSAVSFPSFLSRGMTPMLHAPKTPGRIFESPFSFTMKENTGVRDEAGTSKNSQADPRVEMTTPHRVEEAKDAKEPALQRKVSFTCPSCASYPAEGRGRGESPPSYALLPSSPLSKSMKWMKSSPSFLGHLQEKNSGCFVRSSISLFRRVSSALCALDGNKTRATHTPLPEEVISLSSSSPQRKAKGLFESSKEGAESNLFRERTMSRGSSPVMMMAIFGGGGVGKGVKLGDGDGLPPLRSLGQSPSPLLSSNVPYTSVSPCSVYSRASAELKQKQEAFVFPRTFRRVSTRNMVCSSADGGAKEDREILEENGNEAKETKVVGQHHLFKEEEEENNTRAMIRMGRKRSQPLPPMQGSVSSLLAFTLTHSNSDPMMENTWEKEEKVEVKEKEEEGKLEVECDVPLFPLPSLKKNDLKKHSDEEETNNSVVGGKTEEMYEKEQDEEMKNKKNKKSREEAKEVSKDPEKIKECSTQQEENENILQNVAHALVVEKKKPQKEEQEEKNSASNHDAPFSLLPQSSSCCPSYHGRYPAASSPIINSPILIPSSKLPIYPAPSASKLDLLPKDGRPPMTPPLHPPGEGGAQHYPRRISDNGPIAAMTPSSSAGLFSSSSSCEVLPFPKQDHPEKEEKRKGHAIEDANPSPLGVNIGVGGGGRRRLLSRSNYPLPSSYRITRNRQAAPTAALRCTTSTLDAGDDAASLQSFPVEMFETGRLLKRKDRRTGAKYINNYALIKEIGRGAFSRVKLAYDNVQNRLVAIKQVRRARTRFRVGGPSESQQFYDGFMREINILRRLRHKNIVSVYEIIDDPSASVVCLVMEFIDCGAIRKVEMRPGTNMACEPIPAAELVGYAKEMLSGLAYLHRKDVVHRDIKPENILINSQKRVYLADFGVAEAFDDLYRTKLERLMMTSVGLGQTSIALSNPSVCFSEQHYGDVGVGSGIFPPFSTSRFPSPPAPPVAGSGSFPIHHMGLVSSNDELKQKVGMEMSPTSSAVGSTLLEGGTSGSGAGPAFHPSSLSNSASPETWGELKNFLPVLIPNDDKGGGPLVLGIRGTMLYLAPELWTGRHSSGKPVDIWAMGVTLYTLLTGTLPFVQLDDIFNPNLPVIPTSYGMDWAALLKGMMHRDTQKRLTASQALYWIKKMYSKEKEKDRRRRSEAVTSVSGIGEGAVGGRKSPSAKIADGPMSSSSSPLATITPLPLPKMVEDQGVPNIPHSPTTIYRSPPPSLNQSCTVKTPAVLDPHTDDEITSSGTCSSSAHTSSSEGRQKASKDSEDSHLESMLRQGKVEEGVVHVPSVKRNKHSNGSHSSPLSGGM